MEHIMQKLVLLQRLQLGAKSPVETQTSRIQELRREVPAPILAHFDRLLARGKNGVAVAHNGICGECHLRISSGSAAALQFSNEIHLCDNCGRYLYLPESERAAKNTASEPGANLPRVTKSPSGRGRKRTNSHAVPGH